MIRVEGWKMNANDIQEKIARLPEIADVFVLGVHDGKYTERVAAIIRHSRCSTTDADRMMTIQDLRDRLRSRDLLPLYKMPTVLRILRRYLFLILDARVETCES